MRSPNFRNQKGVAISSRKGGEKGRGIKIFARTPGDQGRREGAFAGRLQRRVPSSKKKKEKKRSALGKAEKNSGMGALIEKKEGDRRSPHARAWITGGT